MRRTRTGTPCRSRRTSRSGAGSAGARSRRASPGGSSKRRRRWPSPSWRRRSASPFSSGTCSRRASTRSGSRRRSRGRATSSSSFLDGPERLLEREQRGLLGSLDHTHQGVLGLQNLLTDLRDRVRGLHPPPDQAGGQERARAAAARPAVREDLLPLRDLPIAQFVELPQLVEGRRLEVLDADLNVLDPRRADLVRIDPVALERDDHRVARPLDVSEVPGLPAGGGTPADAVHVHAVDHRVHAVGSNARLLKNLLCRLDPTAVAAPAFWGYSFFRGKKNPPRPRAPCGPWERARNSGGGTRLWPRGRLRSDRTNPTNPWSFP